jgi:hypothetical protein
MLCSGACGTRTEMELPRGLRFVQAGVATWIEVPIFPGGDFGAKEKGSRARIFFSKKNGAPWDQGCQMVYLQFGKILEPLRMLIKLENSIHIRLVYYTYIRSIHM